VAVEDGNMNELPKKITADYVSRAPKLKENHGPSDYFKEGLNLLIQIRCFGLAINGIPALSRRMYENPIDRPLWGEGRLANLSSGHLSCTFKEAEYLHFYFEKAMGIKWANLVTAKELVTQPLAKNIEKGLKAELMWPIDLPAAYGLNSVFSRNDNSELSLKFYEEEEAPKRGATCASDNTSNRAYPNDSRPIHRGGWKFLVNISGVQNENVFIFETYDSEIEYPDGTDVGKLYNIFPLNLTPSFGCSDVKVSSKNGQPFKIIKDLPGGFIMHALTFPEEWDFQEKFEVSAFPKTPHWEEGDGAIFLTNLQKWLSLVPNELQLTSYKYYVPE